MYLYPKTYMYIILCRWRYTHDGHLIHVDQNMAQLLIKLGIFGGSLAPCLLYYREMKAMCAWND